MKKVNVIQRLEEIETLKHYIPTSKVSQIKPSQLSNLYLLTKGFVSDLIEDCNTIYKNNSSSSNLVELANSLASLCNVKRILRVYALNDGCEDERLCHGVGHYLAKLRKDLRKIEKAFRSLELA